MTTPLKELTAEELVNKGIAPVKREYWKPYAARSEVPAVGGAQAQASAALTEKKSKRQARKDRDDVFSLCINFLAGKCEFERCRFSHDVEAFLKQKPKDLPGQCPFSSSARCPFGITCQFSSSHHNPDKHTLKYTQGQQGSNTIDKQNGVSQLQNSAVATADAAVHAEVPSGPSVELANPSNGTAALSAEHKAQQPVTEHITDVPSHVELPVAPAIYDSMNTMSRDLQSQLRRQTYDFGRADAVLNKLGIKISRQNKSRRKGTSSATASQSQAQTSKRSSSPEETEQPAKRACTDSQPSASQTTAQAADAAAAANAEHILHVPSISSDLAGNPKPESQNCDQLPGSDAALLAPTPQPGSASEALASQTSLAAAAAAAIGTPSQAPATASSAQAQPDRSSDARAASVSSEQPLVNGANSANGTSASDGPGNGHVQHPDGHALLYDVSRQHTDNASDIHVDVPLRPQEKKRLDVTGKLYLAPLTTVGNLPFRRICKGLGADITCGEMALATNLLQGQGSEWALLKRHPCEDVFGVQVCGGFADSLARTAQLIEQNCDVDFVDVNMGCPIDLICSKNAGASLLQRPKQIEKIVRSMSSILSCPLTIKLRKGYLDDHDVAHNFVREVQSWGASGITLHGRSRQQRYSREADWTYVTKCAQMLTKTPLIGNGDVFAWTDYQAHVNAKSPVATCMIARGALIKPWIFQEIKEQRHIDISPSERLDILKQFCSNGLEHWGSDAKGVETTRRFLLEWLSFLYRYVPVGLLEVVPQCMQWRPPAHYGRSDLETLLASDNAADWVKISEMLLGPTPAKFSFAPKHKSNAYARSETEMAQDAEAAQENG